MAAKLAATQAKNNAIFARLTSLYNVATKLPTDSANLRSVETFMAESETLSVIRTEFITNLDLINEFGFEENEEFVPDYQSLNAFEDIYARIQRVRSRIIENSQAPRASVNKGACALVKLPPIDIPSFDGKIENWPIFYESFKANIHLNPSLSDSQRIQYLTGKLAGTALKIIAGIIPSGENYADIWASLEQRYQDKRALGCHYMSTLFNIKPAINNSVSLNAFSETFNAAVSALEQLKINDLKDFILLNMALRKIDAATAQAFEMHIRDKPIPSYSDFIEFTKSQVKILDRTEPRANRGSSVDAHLKNISQSRVRNYQSQSFFTSDDNMAECCLICNKSDHQQFYKCPTFKSMPVKGRFDFVKSKRACVNCLSLSHTASQCKSTYSCKSCKKPHHTLLHLDKNNIHGHHDRPLLPPPPPQDHASGSRPPPAASGASGAPGCVPPAHFSRSPPASAPPGSEPPPVTLCARLDAKQSTSTILLSTAQVNILNNENQNVSVRCLIDNASQNNIITSACCEQLKLKPITLSNSFIKGIGSASQSVRGYVPLLVASRDKKYSYKITALVVDNITDRMPAEYVDTTIVQHLADLPLADPLWHIPGEVELILGAQLFPYLLLGGRVIAPPAPPAIETVFGFILMGDVPTVTNNKNNNSVSSFLNINSATFFTCSSDMEVRNRFDDLQLDRTLTKFWEMEEMPSVPFMSPEETQCEEFYCSTVSRDSTGRYCTALPFCRDPSELGDSRSVALRRLLALEHKLQDPELRASYNEVVQDYLDNDYLSEVPPHSDDSSLGYFIPHHAVVRRDKETTKVRIVLDASAKCHNGISLNDVLHTGANLQSDIFLLLLNFRLFAVAMAADIKQMYMRILMKPEHRKYQRILFRFDITEPVKEYEFNRVAFGLKCSPYLAMRTVRQLAHDERENYPRAAEVASHELYMDDLTTSVSTVDEGKRLSQELISLFKAGGFHLTKWASNSPELLDSVPETNRAAIVFSNNENIKVLGLKWLPASDVFTFSTSPMKDEIFTKRSILSNIARLWDVLGFAAPCVLFAKLLLQELWLLKIGWDDPLPAEIHNSFRNFVEQLPLLSACEIPRHLGVHPTCTINIVAFADASMKAYGSVVYLHVTDSVGNVHVNLVCAKSKVAPLKVVTLARLELCAAVLMSKLVRLVNETYSARTKIDNIFAFSDSKIALSWIHSLPHRWDIYVSNRVAKCQENLDPRHFYHVSGIDNPSDCLSRGLLPEQLLAHPLWWTGSPWLCSPVAGWPIVPFIPEPVETLPEFKSKTLVCANARPVEPGVLYNVSKKCSSWNKILRIITYVLKFTRILPYKDRLNAHQLNIAERYLIHDIQGLHFAELMNSLKTNKAITSPLRKLDLFIDPHGIIRIGGRLSNSNLPYEAKYPALLPKHDHITHLLIDYYHRMYCHTGASVLSSLLRQKYWIIAARSVIRQRIHACNPCFRNAPTHLDTKMADLPSYRIQETKAFVHTGLDYAGPINITLCRRRGQRSVKSYICLFICLVTKAVHIELATDLSTDAFVSAFKRFISRRGPVTHMYSDNGTNFVGAKSQINELLLDRRIEWHMIPPRAPHFGGIWESNIKSIKMHLYRVIGSQLLTYEELLTVLTQVETILNSRPLCVLSEDPYPEPLTPAHFIMASPLTYLPAAPVAEETKTLRHRKELLDQMVHSYWKRWRLEYLNGLQVRQKWLTDKNNAQIGTIVLIHQDDVAPLRWPIGVIQEVYPGRDGRVRVAMVKTATGTFKRPIVKLCPLPSQ